MEYQPVVEKEEDLPVVLLDDEELRITGRRIWVVGDSLFLDLEYENKTEKDLELVQIDAANNGFSEYDGPIYSAFRHKMKLYAGISCRKYMKVELKESEKPLSSFALQLAWTTDGKLKIFQVKTDLNQSIPRDVENGIESSLSDASVLVSGGLYSNEKEPVLSPEVFGSENLQEYQKQLSFSVPDTDLRQIRAVTAMVACRYDGYPGYSINDYELTGDVIYPLVRVDLQQDQDGAWGGIYSGLVLGLKDQTDQYIPTIEDGLQENGARISLLNTIQIEMKNHPLLEEIVGFMPEGELSFAVISNEVEQKATIENLRIELDELDISELSSPYFEEMNVENRLIELNVEEDGTCEFGEHGFDRSIFGSLAECWATNSERQRRRFIFGTRMADTTGSERYGSFESA